MHDHESIRNRHPRFRGDSAHHERPSAQDRAAFTIGGTSVPVGQRRDIDLQVPGGATDPATYIPVTVFHGVHPGPVLALTMEYTWL